MFMGIGKLLKLEKAVAKLPAAMTPTKIDGKWRAPELSRRAIAELRKAVLFMHRCALYPSRLLPHSHSPARHVLVSVHAQYRQHTPLPPATCKQTLKKRCI
jgi:hypothetical protein